MNNYIFFGLHGLANQSNFLDSVILFLAEVFPFVVIVLAGVFVLFHKDKLPLKEAIQKKWQEVALVFFSGAFAWTLATLLKNIFSEPRPFITFDIVNPIWLESGYAFPSGHATFFIALAMAIYLKHKSTGMLFFFFALIISIARIVAGVHYPIDILGGMLLGIFIASVVDYISCKIQEKV